MSQANRDQEYEQLVAKMQPRLMAMGRQFFGSTMEAEEMVQETWLRVWNVRDRVTLSEPLVMRIARNCCVSIWRGQRTTIELEDGQAPADMVTSATPQEELEEKENSEWLRGRVERLPKAEREVWQMFYEEGLTVEEIAVRRGISARTVCNTISSIRHHLRADLRRHFFTPRKLIMLLVFALVIGVAVAAVATSGLPRRALEQIFPSMEDTTIYDTPEVVPSYPGDMEAFWKFLMTNLHYPESAEADSVQGRVIVRFVVEKDGRLTNYEVLQSPDDRLSEEALRVLKMMPRWQPAQQNGRKVRSRFKIPVVFRLN